MTTLRKDLPDYLYWLTEKVEALVKPAAFLRKAKGTVAPMGGTRAWGLPDVPYFDGWPTLSGSTHENSYPACWGQSPYDGESFKLQLNLEDIPSAVRKPEWPEVGVVWVFIDLSGRWEATVKFDPRPAASIKWQPRLDSKIYRAPEAAELIVADTITCCSEQTLPEIVPVDDMAETYDEWAQENYACRTPSNIQIGGWVWPIQGDYDRRNADFVCALERQHFGDNGAVYLHYNTAQGFYALAETC